MSTGKILLNASHGESHVFDILCTIFFVHYFRRNKAVFIGTRVIGNAEINIWSQETVNSQYFFSRK